MKENLKQLLDHRLLVNIIEMSCSYEICYLYTYCTVCSEILHIALHSNCITLDEWENIFHSVLNLEDRKSEEIRKG